METLLFKKLAVLFITFSFMLFTSDRLFGQVDTVLQLPCPVGNIKTTQISGKLTAESSTRHKPIIINDCKTSNNEYPYQVFYVRILDQPTLQIKNTSNVDVAIYSYSADQNLLVNPCNYLLWVIPQNQTLDIKNQLTDEIWTIVVHAANLGEYPSFTLDFSENIQLLANHCSVKYYSVCDKDTISEPDSKILFNPIFEDQVIVNDSIISHQNNRFNTLIKTYTINDRIVARSEHFVHKGKMVDFPNFYQFPDLADFSLSCAYKGDLSPQSLYRHLKETIGDSLASIYQWPGMFDNTICNQVYSTYKDEVNEASGSSIPKTIIRTFKFENWLNGDTFKRTQKISIYYDQPVKVQQFDVLNLSTDPWSCQAMLALPTPILTSDCTPNIKYLKLYNKWGFLYQQENGKYPTLSLDKGTYQFYYIYDDGINKPNTSILNVNVIKSQNSPYLQLPVYYIESNPYQISTLDFKDYVISNCNNYEVTVEEPVTPCDSINDGLINLCCEMIENPSNGYYAKVTFKEYGLDSSDQIVLLDSFWQTVLLDVRQQIFSIECPENVVLDCKTQDWGPTITGTAIGTGFCSSENIWKYSDHILPINNMDKIISRTFRFPNFGDAQHTCTQKITLECTSGTEEQNTELDIQVVPNPFDEQISIKLKNLEEDASIQFFDISGSHVYGVLFYDMTNNKIKVNTSHWPKNALYIYKLISKGRIFTGKIVKY